MHIIWDLRIQTIQTIQGTSNRQRKLLMLSETFFLSSSFSATLYRFRCTLLLVSESLNAVFYLTLLIKSEFAFAEVQKFVTSRFFGWDADMYCPETGEPPLCNSSDLNEELGQVYLHTESCFHRIKLIDSGLGKFDIG